MVTAFDWLPMSLMLAMSVPFTGMVVFAARAQLTVAVQVRLPGAAPVQPVNDTVQPALLDVKPVKVSGAVPELVMVIRLVLTEPAVPRIPTAVADSVATAEAPVPVSATFFVGITAAT